MTKLKCSECSIWGCPNRNLLTNNECTIDVETTTTNTVKEITVKDEDEIDQLLKHCNDVIEENKEIKRGIDFLINEYYTNKRYFREEPGEVTIEDIIKTCFEFGWSSNEMYNYKE